MELKELEEGFNMNFVKQTFKGDNIKLKSRAAMDSLHKDAIDHHTFMPKTNRPNSARKRSFNSHKEMKKSSSRLHSRKKIETVSHVKKGVFD